MRTILGLACLWVLMVATAMAQEIGGGGVTTPPPPVTCDGTSIVKDKCNGGLPPPGYIESATCEAKYVGDKGCKNAIAFAQDFFTCSAPAPEPGTNPPVYSSYCADSPAIITCAHLRTCLSMVENVDGVIYTTCLVLGDPTETLRYRKQKLTSLSTPPGCTAAFVTP